MAASKDSLVRVLGSKNRLAITLPWHTLYCSFMFADMASARENRDIISPLERSSMVTRLLLASVMATPPSPISSGLQFFLLTIGWFIVGRTDDSHFIAAVGVGQTHLDFFVTGAGDILADIVRADGHLAVAAVDKHRQLYGARAAEVDKGVHGSADAAAGVKNIIDEHHGLVINM